MTEYKFQADYYDPLTYAQINKIYLPVRSYNSITDQNPT